EAGFIRKTNFDWRGRVNYTKIESEATDLGDEPLISIGTSTEVRKGYPVPSFFARKLTNPGALANPIPTDTLVFIGPTFPDQVIGLGTTFSLWGSVTIDGLGEFQRGGHNINYI